jgi:flagellar biosynthetic protein FlhB
MAEDDDDASKTEQPTGKKLEDARKKGNIVSTRELNHFFMLLAVIFFLTVMAPRIINQTIALLSPFITRPESFPMDAASVSGMLDTLTIHAALLIALTLLLTFIAALAPVVIQGKWVFSAEQMKPRLDKLSPLAGFKRIYSRKSLIEFAKNFVKIMVVGVACMIAVRPYLDDLPGLLRIDTLFSLGFAGQLARRMMIATTLFLFLLSIVDYLYQRFSFLKSQRMTKQEVKDEYKQQEGDPVFKGKMKQMRTQRARRRMMANVPKADVVVTNPTHYAVALQYDAANMAVPKVIAKGTDEIAARIREIAEKHKIIIVRNPPLARVLYATTEVEEEIPAEQYKAVAQIISYVYQLKGKRPTQRPKPPTGYGLKKRK